MIKRLFEKGFVVKASISSISTEAFLKLLRKVVLKVLKKTI